MDGRVIVMCPAIAERLPFTVEHGLGETRSGDALRRSDAVFAAEGRDKPLSQVMWRSIANSRLVEAREVRRLLVSDVAHPAFDVSARELIELAEKFPEAMPSFSTSEGEQLVARSIEASIEATDTGAIALACKRFGRDAREPPFVERAIDRSLRLLRSASASRFDRLRRVYRFDVRAPRFARAAVEGAVRAIAQDRRADATRVLAVCGIAEDPAQLAAVARELCEPFEREPDGRERAQIARAFSIELRDDPLDDLLLRLSSGELSRVMREPPWRELARDDDRVRAAAERGIAAAAALGATDEIELYEREFSLHRASDAVREAARKFLIYALADELVDATRLDGLRSFAERVSIADELPKLALDAAIFSYESRAGEDPWLWIEENPVFAALGATRDRVREHLTVEQWCERFRRAPQYTITMMRAFELPEERFDEVEYALVLRASREDRWFSAAFVIDSFAFDEERERARARDFVDPPTDLSKRERHAWARELLALLGPDAVWDALLREARACPQLGAELVVWFVENQDFSIEDGVYRFEHASTRSAVTIRAVLALLAEREPALYGAVVERWSGRASELFQSFVR
ncbi:MAG: hypothetical protein JNK05_10385 [Myxococcales bacterium]|nr:hypothetical protein [Myxococcales bacterium]